VRYTAGERTNHWIVALAFVLAALSGLALFHPALFWLSDLFGGGPWTRILHPFIALVMLFAFLFFAAGMWKDNLLQPRDWAWLRRIKDVVNNREEELPEVGRYNAGQKLLFFTIVACMVGLILSGLVIWRAYFSTYFSIGVIRLASLAHAVCAFVLICAIVVHIYSALWIKGSVDAMTRGTVTPGWAWKHHRAWFRERTRATHSPTRRD
jgi:formate dehydrogenase subunit gamma